MTTARPTVLTLPTPADYRLARDACSYGYFILAPNFWDVRSQTFSRALELEGGPVLVTVSQPNAPHAPGGDAPAPPLRARFSRALTRSEQAEAKRQLVRMFLLDFSAEDAAAFHAVDPRWKASGRARLMRSPTLFEDILKTVTSCNIAWPATQTMNHQLCRVLGRRVPGLTARTSETAYTFPSPQKLARARLGTLRGRCRVGYRDARMQQLARMFARGEIDGAWLEDPATPDAEVERYLLDLPGIGPYAAANIMQLLRRYSRLALDTESVRHGRAVLGMEGETPEILRRLREHYEPFGRYRFLSYWFELWDFYEAKRGPAHTWDRDTTGRTFTAALLA